MTRVQIGIHCSLQTDGSMPADGNVAMSRDGQPIFAVAEERVSRRKYDGDFRQGLRYALDRTGVSAGQVEVVGVSTYSRYVESSDADLDDIRTIVRAELGRKAAVEIARSHHEIHAFAAAAYCPEREALIAVLDNEGSLLGAPTGDRAQWAFEKSSYYRRIGEDLELVARDHDGPGEVGYGKAYSKITRYLGFQSYQEAGKTMGLAPFGGPRGDFPQLFERRPGARNAMRNTQDGLKDLESWFEDHAVRLGGPRSGAPISKLQADLAYWIQAELEASVFDRARGLLAATQAKALAMSGGVALNCVMNSRLRALPVSDVFVPPSPGDAGLAVGVLAWLERRTQGRIPLFRGTPYLGGDYSAEAAKADLAPFADQFHLDEVADPVADAADHLARGLIVGWMQGGSEYGPRSLGARSILADPRQPWMKEVLNNLVKGREWFRPYAPAVLIERAGEFFEEPFGSPYMMHTARCRDLCIRSAPAAVHVDDTARLQTVHRDLNPMFHRLIEAFADRTGLPILLNTSFNLGGEPIVEKPSDVARTLLNCPRLDLAYVGAIRLRRREGAVTKRVKTSQAAPASAFA